MEKEKELWEFSPSSINAFSECGCTWLDYHYGGPPNGPMPVINSALHVVLTARYDKYRKHNKFPPEVDELKKMSIKPFTNLELLISWRKSSKVLRFTNKKDGYLLKGKLDELALENDGKIIPVDFKTTGYRPKESKEGYYREQLESYAFLLEKLGYKVSNRGLLLHYFLKNVSSPAIPIQFDAHIDPVKLDTKKIQSKLRDMVKFLDKPYPGFDKECEWCSHYKERQLLIRKHSKK